MRKNTLLSNNYSVGTSKRSEFRSVKALNNSRTRLIVTIARNEPVFFNYISAFRHAVKVIFRTIIAYHTIVS